MRVAITGHRPERIKDMGIVVDGLAEAYRDLGVTEAIQGMAAGVDLQSARVAYLSGIPFWSVKPWAGHTPRKADEVHYKNAWGLADKRFVVNPSEKYLGPWMYQRRNEWMVDNSHDAVLAVWDGTENGGTFNCVKYARAIHGMRIWVIHPDTGELTKYA
jgi:uncharacterized phage-like protein YoqJ